MVQMHKKDRIGQYGSFMRPTAIYKADVAPGSTLDMDAEINWMTDVFVGPIMSPMEVRVDFFYCPLRLIDANFVAELSEGATITVPKAALDMVQVMDWANGGTTNHNAWPRRVYKLIFDEYYGDEQTSQWYGPTNVLDDGITGTRRVRTTEQMVQRVRPQAEITDVTIPAVSTVSIKDVIDGIQRFRSKELAEASGDAYVDVMRAMGVQLDWRLQMAPEHLGSKSQVVRPSMFRINDPAGTANGSPSSQFYGTLKCGFKRKRFAEHGIVMGILSMRPKVGREVGTFGLTRGSAQFWKGETTAELDENTGAQFGLAGNPVFLPQFGDYRLGQNVQPAGFEPWSLDVTNTNQLLYPDVDTGTSGQGFLLGDFHVMGYYVLQGRTPVPHNALQITSRL